MSRDEEQERDLKQFEAELASLVPRRDRVDPAWGSYLAEKAAERLGTAAARTGPVETVRCEGRSGHVFVCVYCGRSADRSAGVGRWAWPASLAAMTSVAAVLLVMLVAGRGVRVIDRTAGPPPAGAAPHAVIANSFGDDAYSVALQPWRDGNQRILTAADRILPDNFLARSNSLAYNGHSLSKNIDAGERPLTSSEFLRHILRQPGAAGDPFYRSIF